MSTLISLLQVPHLDIKAEIDKRSDRPLSENDWTIIDRRIAVAKKWLEDYADPEEKLTIYFDRLPDTVKDLTPEQIEYLTGLKEGLAALETWDAEALQTAIFSAAKARSISPKVAFPAIYYSFLGKERGPKAGGLFSYLEREFVLGRIQEAIALNS